MKFNGILCDYCGKPFADGDDIVVCPDCGTPHHRTCWKELGHCVHQSRHAAGFVWHAEFEAAPSVPLEQQSAAPRTSAAPTGDGLICPRCGTENARGSTHCELCSAPLLGQAAQQQRPQQDPSAPNQNARVYDAQTKIGEELTVREIAAYVGANVRSFLPRFKHMADRNFPVSFNLPAFFFGPFYCFYRKMNKHGAILLTLIALSYIPFMVSFIPYYKEVVATGVVTMEQFTNIPASSPYADPMVLGASIVQYVTLAIRLLCGLFFNHFYMKQILQEVRIQRYRGHAAVGTDLYYSALSRRGGTSMLAVLLVGMLVIVGSSILMSLALMIL